MTRERIVRENLLEVAVPAIGDFEDVEVIELLVALGDRVDEEQSLITLEGDKATMEIPSPSAGVVRELLVEIGSHVAEGTPVLRLETAAVAEAIREEAAAATSSKNTRTTPSAGPGGPPSDVSSEADLHVEVAVIGSGPGGYTAAFRAADLGKRVALIERYPTLGGVCLNVGCIPSKALLHIADVVMEVRALAKQGVTYGEPTLDLSRIRKHKAKVVKKLTTGLAGLAKRRKVNVLTGNATFEGPNLLRVAAADGAETTVSFEHAIIAVGSEAVNLPGIPGDDPRVMDSTAALELEEIPARLLVIGGGIIGLEMASVFHALGSRVTVVELLDALMLGTDPDLVKPLRKIIDKRYENIYTGTKVTRVEARDDGLHVGFEGGDAPAQTVFDRVLVAVGRRPKGGVIAAEKAGVAVDERGFISVDAQQRTNISHIFAIGDVVGQPMLAHKATHEGVIAAEVIAGKKSTFAAKAIPSVAYTDPEVAWMGLTETEASESNTPFEKSVFPWAASGRALGIAREEGMTKLLFDPESGRLLGAGIVGPHAGELIAEAVLALEMGADAEDLALTIHAHPTLSETLSFAAEVAEGTITDLYLPRRKGSK